MPITVNQIVPNYGFADAIGNQITETSRLLRALGVQTTTFADAWDSNLGNDVRPMTEYQGVAGPEAWAILHFGVCGRANDLARDLPGKLVLYYHNVTPAAFYAPYNALITICMRQARLQLATLVTRGRTVAASDYNRTELERLGFRVDAVAPYIMLLERLQKGLHTPAAEAARERFKDVGRKTWLYVGRMAPNKKVEDVIRAFAYYQSNIEPASRLLLVGNAQEKDRYFLSLKELIASLNLEEAVIFPGHLPAEALGVFYEIADAYICLSEHEGFCVPLIEAMSFDLPVVALASTGMPGTLGDSGVLLHRKEPALVAEVMHEVITNQALRQGLITRQRRRVADFEPGKMRLQLHRSLIAAGIPLPEPVVA